MFKFSRSLSIAFPALGVVYGDIGTSPLYALRQCLMNMPGDALNVESALSMIFWTLILVISIKYLMVVLQADNEGEGGIMALVACLKSYLRQKSSFLLLLFSIAGVGLILGDGMLTPAISVLSATEGLETLSPLFSNMVVPVTILILIPLFWFQRNGTGKIGRLFAPIIFGWFVVIGILGLVQIIHQPQILKAVNPWYAIQFFMHYKLRSFVTLGSVFLVATGGEALYADIGHFGKNAIRLNWFVIVLPSLLLNYFGQGAYLLTHAKDLQNPFYDIVPHSVLPAMIILAAAATVIASQAIIAAVFSIIRQAILLNLLPRLKVIQTSALEKGQIYLPVINLLLGLGSCFLVLVFQSSERLANAYGIAVNLDMVITTILVLQVAVLIWEWSLYKRLFFVIFFVIDISFLIGNLHKLLEGGWVPLCIASICGAVMYSWYKGSEQLRELNFQDSANNRMILEDFNTRKIPRIPGTALFITDPYDEMGGSLLHHLKINRMLNKTIIFLSVCIDNKPYVTLSRKFEILQQAEGFYLLNIHYGFAENIHIPTALEKMCKEIALPFELDLEEMAYFIEIISLDISRHRKDKMHKWQKHLFSFMLRNAVPDIQFYCLPYNKTVAIGTYYKI